MFQRLGAKTVWNFQSLGRLRSCQWHCARSQSWSHLLQEGDALVPAFHEREQRSLRTSAGGHGDCVPSTQKARLLRHQWLGPEPLRMHRSSLSVTVDRRSSLPKKNTEDEYPRREIRTEFVPAKISVVTWSFWAAVPLLLMKAVMRRKLVSLRNHINYRTVWRTFDVPFGALYWI